MGSHGMRVLGVSLSAGALNIGQAGPYEVRSTMERFSPRVDLSPSIHSPPAITSPSIDELRAEPDLRPTFVEPTFSGGLQERCATACGYHKAGGQLVPDNGCKWVDRDDPKDLRTTCE